MKIRTKIQLFSIVWLLVIIIIINTSIYFAFSNLLIENELEEVESQVANIAAFMSTSGESDTAPSRMLRPYVPSSGMIRIISENNEATTVVTQRPELFEVAVTHYSGQEREMLELPNGEWMAVAYFPLIWEDGSVVSLEVMRSLQPIQDTLHLLRLVLVIASVLILLPALFGGALLSRLILRPIQAMVKTMMEIQQKGTLKKIDIDGQTKDELYHVAGTFNTMVDLLRENMEKKQQFVHDASHELKTPLTVIESNANMLKRWGAKNPEILEESIDAIHSEAKRMKELTGQMLALADDYSTKSLAFEKVDLIKLIEETSTMMEKTYHRQIQVNLDVPSTKLFVLGEEKKLQQVLVILLDNAIKYSKDNILLHLGIDGENVFFTIKDHGIGIPAEQLDKVFDRFYRVDSVRSRKTGGTGLGLAIAKTIVDSHLGEIDVESEEDVGTTFIVSLPKHH
ncbi:MULTISPECIES: sensor histidine kinase [Bacillaceae]|uniref:histidine kinase n=1 Tax=Evansella alkalicola TaxID=745819 RepID=A0ABS6JRL0_9BACI|nr:MULTISPECIES: HAMP domain-containing sensor histidine kinase [Bacillaceae]MBU9720877.1 HAMP domain-containing histidine kinase [Bacillus alkalicola]